MSLSLEKSFRKGLELVATKGGGEEVWVTAVSGVEVEDVVEMKAN